MLLFSCYSASSLKSTDIKKGVHEKDISEFPAREYLMKIPLGSNKIIKK